MIVRDKSASHRGLVFSGCESISILLFFFFFLINDNLVKTTRLLHTLHVYHYGVWGLVERAAALISGNFRALQDVFISPAECLIWKTEYESLGELL